MKPALFKFQLDVLRLKKRHTFWFTDSGRWQTMPFYFAPLHPSRLSDNLKLVLQFRRGWKGCGGFDRPTVTKKL